MLRYLREELWALLESLQTASWQLLAGWLAAPGQNAKVPKGGAVGPTRKLANCQLAAVGWLASFERFQSSDPGAGVGSLDFKPQGVEVWRPYLKACNLEDWSLEGWLASWGLDDWMM